MLRGFVLLLRLVLIIVVCSNAAATTVVGTVSRALAGTSREAADARRDFVHDLENVTNRRALFLIESHCLFIHLGF